VDAYRQTWNVHRYGAGRLNGHVAEPKVGVPRQVFVEETDDDALAATRTAHGDWYRSITKLWHDHDDSSVDGLSAWETAIQHETIIFGSPVRVRRQIARLLEASGCNYLICSFAWGSLTREQILRSFRFFAQEVMPAFSGDTPLGVSARDGATRTNGVTGRPLGTNRRIRAEEEALWALRTPWRQRRD
jgi:alkanesulfonate monooxygenase SsuD/methylene tetrahydromethanopterin reductase-like flavin-dependent oxidoreductase (luciferase family)